MSVSELACTYAALILHDDGIPITAERIATLVKAANVSVESFWPTLFSKLLAKRNVDDLLLKVGTAAAPVAVAASDVTYADPADAPAAEEKEEETEEESDDDIGYGLFDD